jgi:hypothetical protein
VCDRKETLLFGLREDEKMGETYRGSATPLTEERTDQMIYIISIGLVFALFVGGFVVAANSYGDQDQDQIPEVNVPEMALDYIDPTVIAQQQTLREPDLVVESEIHPHSHSGFLKRYHSQNEIINPNHTILPPYISLK